MLKYLTLLACCVMIGGCASTKPPLPTARNVDLERFMGPWYIIAAIPTFIEREAYNAVETYSLNSDGTIDTVYTFNKGGFDGSRKRYNPKGFIVDDGHNSTWGMQFVWPIKAEYLITYVNEDYTQTIIGRNQRDYFWLMARDPEIPAEDYKRLMALLKSQGYDMTKVRQFPHQF